jgi:hypothetical protein
MEHGRLRERVGMKGQSSHSHCGEVQREVIPDVRSAIRDPAVASRRPFLGSGIHSFVIAGLDPAIEATAPPAGAVSGCPGQARA